MTLDEKKTENGNDVSSEALSATKSDSVQSLSAFEAVLHSLANAEIT
jgi:hypothetical protein